ncbi:FAD-dependent oxidoreductase, variant [Magnaporthiopsis poae ATCC 64411]|nr:FAD-dependent oxidoreductase, variant [Magnaporthiopsis poae ATCC 64411]
MGCTTAYYLTRHPKYDPEIHTITIVEAAGIASSASGKAGGLLGLWAYPEETVPLSYRLHRELADEHGGDSRWGYRRLQGCGTIRVNLQDPQDAVYGPPPPPDEDGGGGKGRAVKKNKKRKRDTASLSARLNAETTELTSEPRSRSPTTAPPQPGQTQQGQPALETPIPQPTAPIQVPVLAAVALQPEPQQLEPQHLETQHPGSRSPGPQHSERRIDIIPELPLQPPPLEQQVEQIIRQQEHQHLSDKPVPVAVLFGLKTGSCTRWKSIFRYSNGDVTYGPRVPSLPPQNSGDDPTNAKATSPDRTITAPCSESGHQEVLPTIEQEAPNNTPQPNSNGDSVPTETTNHHSTSSSSSNGQDALRTPGAPPRTDEESGTGPNALSAKEVVPPTSEPSHVAPNGSRDAAMNGMADNGQDEGAEGLVTEQLQSPAENVANTIDSGLNGGAAELPIGSQSMVDDLSVTVVVASKDVDVAGLQNGAPGESTDAHIGTRNGITEPRDGGCIHVFGGSSEGATQEPWHKVPKLDETASASMTELPLPAELDWVKRDIVSAWEEQGYLGRNETAQVHPYHFTTSMAALAQERGVNVRLGTKVTRIITSAAVSNGKASGGSGGAVVRGVELLDRNRNHAWTMEDVTDVLVTAGPWTSTLLPQSKVRPVRAHSVVWEADVSPFAVFTSITLPDGYVPAHRVEKGEKRKHNRVDPEAYARPFGEVYACGEIDELVPLPPTADMVEADESQCEDLIAYLGLVSPQLASAPVKARQACYMPERKPHPVFGQTLTPGLWVAAGHSCWGIQHAPATGLLMAEMMMDGRVSSIEPGLIAKFDPRRAKI